MYFRILTTFILLTFSALSFSACGNASDLLGSANDPGIKTVTSTEIMIPIEKVRTLNPVLLKDEDAYYLDHLIYEGLFRLDETLAPVGVLAKSYSYGVDGTSLTVELRNDVVWQDGVAFGASDVKFSVEAYQSAMGSGGSIYNPYISLIQSVKVEGDHTVIVNFKQKTNVAVENLTFPILPSHKYKFPKDLQKQVDGFVPVGTGPYRIESVDPGKSILLVGNSNYYGEVPQNTLLAKIMPGKEEAINLFEIGETHLSILKELDRNTLLDNAKVRVHSFPSNEAEVLGFNFRNETLKVPEVRRAISAAIDRQAILESCYFNSGILNDTIYYPNYLGEPMEAPPNVPDPSEGKKLLNQAGLTQLSFSLLVNGEDHARNLAAQRIKADLAKIGIAVSVVPLSFVDYQVALAAGEFDLYLGGFQVMDTYDMRPLLHTTYQNPIGYSNLNLDMMLDRMQSAITLEQKKELFSKIHDTLTKEIPYVCLLYKTYGFATPVTFQGEIQPMFYDIYRGADQWSIAYETEEKTENTP